MSKKQYVKPAVVFQNLTLSSQIATGCATPPTFAERNCEVEITGWGGITMFIDANAKCDYTTPDMYDMICYHVPTADSNVFSS